MSSNCLLFCIATVIPPAWESPEKERSPGLLSGRIPYPLPFAECSWCPGTLSSSFRYTTGAGRAGAVGAGCAETSPFLASYVGFVAMGGRSGISTDTGPTYAPGDRLRKEMLGEGPLVTVKPDSARRVVHVK